MKRKKDLACIKCGIAMTENERMYSAICTSCREVARLKRRVVLDAMTDEVVAAGLDDRVCNLERE